MGVSRVLRRKSLCGSSPVLVAQKRDAMTRDLIGAAIRAALAVLLFNALRAAIGY